MTIENYFERRIRPIIEEPSKPSKSTNNNTANTANSSNTSSGIIDEDQLARTFQEIVNCINLDDDDETFLGGKKTLLNDTSNIANNNNFSRSNFHHSHHTLLPEFKSIFGGNNMTVVVGAKAENNAKPGGLGKSFLDDDWMISSEGIRTTGASGSASTSTSISSTVSNMSNASIPLSHSRPLTPSSSFFNHSNHTNNNAYNSPPGDYVCKLCNREGHWMKDCRLYEPRSPSSISSGSSFKSTSSSSINSVAPPSRTLLPPGNYVCRLCNVAGHWIDQCIKFQPKDTGNTNTLSSTPVLPPMLGPGPTPNYRPPAYLSKPVPSNYLCNLCNRPGHWIQQCTEFTPIINKRP